MPIIKSAGVLHFSEPRSLCLTRRSGEDDAPIAAQVLASALLLPRVPRFMLQQMWPSRSLRPGSSVIGRSVRLGFEGLKVSAGTVKPPYAEPIPDRAQARKAHSDSGESTGAFTPAARGYKRTHGLL